MNDAEFIQSLRDEREIYRLMVYYAARIDANDPTGAASCLHAMA